ncbi:rhodanese-like domain-containing protein [Alloprevotella tannerae]|uniref:Rhodanese-like domain-containing protein n=1 Tax=Alloprevotella tannerae TaxID=76122 RepID=A0A929RX37_9BACT|nr:rhodanese-like domain-containing protein [Alloprevotella tannerae]MBF0970922.1 rhodanese-like domain-containing protein [Alloprevotella tannerae]
MKKLLFSILAALGFFANAQSQSEVEVLEPQAFIERVKADTSAIILDVRQPEEFAEGHLAQAINLDWLNQTVFINGLAKLNKQKTYYVYCRSGRRSQAAAGKLKAEGFQVIDLKGGYLHWVEVGMPVVK